MKSALTKKTDKMEEEHGTKHDLIWITVDGKTVGPVKFSRGSGEMHNREIGHCAQSLGLSERLFKAFVACTLSKTEYAAAITRPA